MSRLGLGFAGGAAVTLVLCGGIAVPVALSIGGMLGQTDLTEGTQLVAAPCGTTEKIQQVARNTPKVAGWTKEAVGHASTIVQVGQEMGVPPRGWVIAVATAMQESTLRNLGHLGDRNDHDSLGLFQQRPSSGWGTPAQVQDPKYAARKFYSKLIKVDGWQQMALTKAAQTVQISAYPNAYAKWETKAAQLVDAVSGGASKTPITAAAVGKCAADTQEVASSGWARPVKAPVGSGWRTASRPTHQGVDLIAPKGREVYSVAAGTVIHLECDRSEDGYDCNRDGSPSQPGCGWYLDIRHANNIITRYCHLLRKPLVKLGDKVNAGQQIGVVGTSGHSSGPHLHFEVHFGSRDASSTRDPVQFMKDRGAPLGTSEKGGEKAT